MSMTKVIETALADLKYTEYPFGSNKTKYGVWYGINGVPWCVQAQAYWFNKAREFKAFMGGEKTASCSQLLAWHKAHDNVVDKSDIRVGDLLILNFSGTQETQHIGLVTEELKDGFYHTVEGNTSPGEEGSQNAGGCVALKTRSVKQVVAVIRPQYKPELPEDVRNHWAEEAIEWAIEEGLMKGYPDGSFQPDKPMTRAEFATVEYRKHKQSSK